MFDGVVVDPAECMEAPPLGHGPDPPPLRGVRIKHKNILRGRPARAAEPPTYTNARFFEERHQVLRRDLS